MGAMYKKLSDGSWGIQLSAGTVGAPGMEVVVSKRDGTSKKETIDQVVSSGKDGSKVCTIRPTPKPAGASSSRGGYARFSSRSRGCKTGGNCSSFGSGRSCGAHDCDGY